MAKLVDIVIIQGGKDLAKIKKRAKRQSLKLKIRRSGKEGNAFVYTVRVYKS